MRSLTALFQNKTVTESTLAETHKEYGKDYGYYVAAAVPVREGYKVIYGWKSEVVEPLKTRILKREK